MLQIAVGLFCVLTAVTLVGHGIWLALEFVFRSLAGGHRTERLPRSLCPRCQQPLWSPESRCLHCAQPTEDTSASEFHDLERALRRIAALQETQALHPKTFRELKECIEARQQALQRQVRPNVHPVVKSTPSIQPVRAENPPVAEPALPLWQQFEKALEVCQDVGDLAVQQRRSLIDWAHDVGAKRRSLLSGKAQLGLARLLRVAGNKQEALAAYRQLLQTHPRFDDGGVAGLEAGRLALQIKSPAEAHDFLEWALGCSLPEEQQLEARRLLETAEKGLPVVELLPEPGPLDGQSNGHHAGRQPIAAALPGAPSAPPPPRRSLVELLAAFMEERNMLWGELVGGLLMVGGSIALVVSLWKTLEGIAYFPFIIFSAITAAIFGAGLYTFHHWKLQSTSRGLLFIGILLVPLDFVVMARLVVEAEGAEAVPRLSIEGLAICLFAFLMKRSTRVLSAGGEWLLVAAVLGASTSPLAIHRIVEYADATGWPFVLLGLWPVVCYCATSAVIVRGARQRQFDEPEVVSLFSFLGLATFPVIVALGFLIYWSGNPGLALGRLAVPVALAGMPILATGLLAHKRLGEPRADGTPQSAALRTAGTTLALTGVTVMLSAVACAWPEPLTILCVCALVFATLTALALIFGPPALHAPALASLAIGYLSGFHYFAGHLSGPLGHQGMRLLEVMASAQSGSALVALVLLLASGGALLNRSGRRGHSTFYAAGAGIIAGLSAALVNFHGIDDPATAMLVSGFYAACALIVNMRVRRTSLGYLSTGLIVLATIWSLWWSEHALTPAWSVTLALEALLMAGCAQWLSTGLVIPRAWRDTAAATACMALTLLLASALKGDTAMHTLAGVLLAATAFVLAWSYRRASIAWAGSALLLGSIWNALGTAFGAWNLDHSWTIALLLHATLVIVVGSAIKTFARGRPDHAVDRVFVRSLLRSGFASSGLVLALLGVPASTPWTSLTIYTSWVAGLWLFLAWLECVPALFTVAQSILALAVYFGVTAWLSAQSVPNPLAGPFGLHAYGIGFGILGLFWASARVLLRVSKVASKLFEPPWPSLDHAMLGLLVLGQMLLAFLGALTGIQAELGLTRGFLDMHWSTAGGYTHGPGAYVLLTILAVDLLFSLRSRQGFEAAGGLVLLCATVPLLLAGSYTQAAAAATVLRWTQAIAFILCSVPLWFYQGAGADFTRGKALARRLLVGTLAIPPILLTIAGAIVWLGGSQPVGPAHDFFRLPLGWVASHAIPLLLVAAGLTGYALRERSSIYAFAAGLVLNLTVAGGYALAVVIDTHGFGPADAVRTIQWGIVTTALWGLCWMVLRRWVYAWREVYIAPQAGVLMRLQVGLAALGTAWLLATSLWLLAFAQSSYWRTIAETGSPLGWLATLLTLIALVYRHHQAGTAPHRHGLGLAGVLLLGLIACSVAALIPDWGFRTLMLAWAGFTPALVIAAWLRQRNIDRLEDSEARAPTTGWRRLALGLCRGLDPEPVAFWVRLLSWMVLVLCLKAALVGPNDRLVAAAALAQIGLASAVMAVWRRREDWAFRAGLCTNLAASLVVWHFRQAIPFEEWGIALAQANLIATSLCGLLWLAARRELYGKQELTLARTPFLGLQVCVGLAGNILILAWPLVTLVSNPASQLSPVLQAVGSVAGWLGLGLAFLAAYLYAGQIAPRQRGHVLVAFGLAVGILAACSVGYHDQASWLSYHVLMGAWIGTGLMILAADSVAGFKEDGPAFSPFPLIARMLHFPAWEFRRWLDFVGVIVLALALRAAWADPTRPYASAGATLAVCAMAGAVALRARSAIYVYISGVLVNLAGAMIWIALSSSTLQDLLHIQVICFALGASIWSALELLLEAATPAVTLRGTSVPFRHLAALAGCLVLALLAFLTIRSDLLLDGTLETGPLCLAALLALMLALGLALWDRSFHFARAAVYALGLMALAFALHAAQLEPRSYGWNATWVLAIYLLVPALLVRGAPLAIPWRQALRLPDRPALTEETWFQPVQALMTFLVLSLSLWVATGFDSVAERLAGPLATFLVMSAVLLLTGGWESIRRYAALYLGVVVLTEIAWALLVGPEEAAPWLHRTALLLVSLVLLTFGYGVRAHSDRLQALFPGAWADVCRRTAPVLGALSCVVLLVLLAQEAFLYDTMLGGTPMALWAIALVALALIALIVAGVFFAVQPHDDPLGLSQQGRTLYVYAGEVLLGLLFIHLRFTAPQLFQFEFFGRFWPFVVMAIAFAGVGLGEYFDRRGLPVLAHPLERTGLFLPLLPLLSFWLVPLARAQPFLLAQPAPYGKHAAIWFLVGGLYSLVAARRRSPRFALLAALTTNIGLWALLYHNKLDFLTHPQMWLIPLALIVLVAEHLNRDRLAASQSAFLRYAALTVIYTSSTSDMFIAGLGESVLLPLVLAVLSIVGILAGILFRVRAFLYLGFTFLFLVIFTQIYHAAVGRNQPWVWWVSLIVLGAAIIALFAVFEKRRNDVMRLLEDVRTWN